MTTLKHLTLQIRMIMLIVQIALNINKNMTKNKAIILIIYIL